MRAAELLGLRYGSVLSVESYSRVSVRKRCTAPGPAGRGHTGSEVGSGHRLPPLRSARPGGTLETAKHPARSPRAREGTVRRWIANALMGTGLLWIFATLIVSCVASFGAPVFEGGIVLTWPATPSDAMRAILTIVVATPGLGLLLLGAWLGSR